MLEVKIPGRETIRVRHLVLDFNGTLACDGVLLDGVSGRLRALSEKLDIHVLTADTFGSVARAMGDVPCAVTVIGRERQAEAKWQYVHELGFDRAVCVGNGCNDVLMLRDAVLGIATLQAEGCAGVALAAAHVTVSNILDGLDLLLNPLRLKATLRA